MTKTTRETIIAHARDMFRDRGYAGFSMGDLANRAGLRKASLYSRFAGKDELAREALALSLAELAAIPVSGDTCARYRALLEGIAAQLVLARRCIGLHLLYDTTSTEIAAANHAFFAELLALCCRTLQDALPPDTARKLAEDSLAALEGATLWLILNGDEAPMRRAVAAQLARLNALMACESNGADRPAPARHETFEN